MQADHIPQEVLNFIEEAVLAERNRALSEGEKFVLSGIWQGKTYEDMAKSSEYKLSYLMQSAGPKLLKLLSRVLNSSLNKTNFRVAIEVRFKQLHPNADALLALQTMSQQSTELDQNIPKTPQNHFDETLDVSDLVFVGRKDELKEIGEYALDKQTKLTIVKGPGGIGKSSLVYRFANEQANLNKDNCEFIAIIFKSLRRPKKLNEFISELLSTCFSLQIPDTELDEVKALEQLISQLIQYLRSFRCLLILDDFQTVFKSKGLVGEYDIKQYGDYGKLVEQLAGAGHNSHIIITCREFPLKETDNELIKRPIRSIDLRGLKSDEVQTILSKRNLQPSPDQLKQLTDKLGGSPLGIRLVAADIQSRYDGSVSRYLEDIKVSDDLGIRVQELIENLTQPEQELLYRIASYGRAVAYSELPEDILSENLLARLKAYIDSLKGRSLLDLDSRRRYLVHPVIAEGSRALVIKDVLQDIHNQHFDELDALILVKATAEEQDRQEQIRSVLEPLQARLKEVFKTNQDLADHLKQCIATLQVDPERWCGYTTGNLFNLLCGLQIDIEGWDFSELTIRQANFKGVNLRYTNFENTTLVDCLLPEGLGCPDTIAFSPKEEKIAVGDADGKVRLWRFDGTSWQFDRAFEREHTGWVWSLAFSPDGELLASGGDDGIVRLWRVNGKKNRSFLLPLEHSGAVKSVGFSANFYCGSRGNDRGFIAATNDEGMVKLWDASVGFEEITDLHLKNLRGIRLAFCPKQTQRQLFAAASNEGNVQLWSCHNNQLECQWELSLHTCAIYALAFSPNGKILATGTANGSLRLWQVETGEQIQLLEHQNDDILSHDDAIWAVSFSHNGDLLASASYDGTVILWDLVDGRAVQQMKAHKGKVLGVAFNQTSRNLEHILVSASDDKTVKSWKIESSPNGEKRWRVQPTHVFEGLTSWVWNLAFSPDGKTLALACDDGQIPLLQIQQKSANQYCLERIKVLRGDFTRTWTVAFSPNGQVLASGGSDNQVKLWDLATGTQVDILKEHTDPVRSVAFSPDNRVLASTSADYTVVLWDLRELDEYLETYRRNLQEGNWRKLEGIVEAIATLTEHDGQVWSSTFSHDNRILASAGEDGKIVLRKFNNGTDDIFKLFAPPSRNPEIAINILEGHEDKIWSLAFNPDDRLLASASSDRTIKFWDVQTSKCIASLEGHTDQVHSVVFSPDGKFLVSGGNDGAINLWDVRQTKLIKTFSKKHDHWIWSIAWNTQYSLIASGSHDETVILWDTKGNEVSKFINQPFAGMNIRGIKALPEEKYRFLDLGAIEQ
ncbi:hypothetical protein WA1_03685 [Scytonema hofmannii PCC 7110]|uniref:Uncharacterized protein n=1 Tax=Scytonema hofmannii PCC 7110 TaxID=128403 RepID=A0A139X921_9CYAN|nr:NACHT domain-containing protein [Scytonema hofmannii]KYC41198.1 hypothetical protein WA1_03685 [Scytonema hofmannii PCC 7110]